MPQSVRTTKGRCTALATLTHRSPCSRFDRRLPSIEFNTPHQAPVERHRKAIGGKKSTPLTSVSVLVSHACQQALNMHLAVSQHRAQHRNLNSTRGRFRPRRYESLASRIGCRSVRQSLEKTLQNFIRETNRSCPGGIPGTFWRALFSTGLTGLSCRKATRKRLRSAPARRLLAYRPGNMARTMQSPVLRTTRQAIRTATSWR